MKKSHLHLLSLLSGILLTVSWPVHGFPAFLFTAFVPLFFIEQIIFENRNTFNRYSVFLYTFPAFFIWNICTSWWIWNSTPVAALAWIFNAMFMSIVFQTYHWSRRNIYSGAQGYFLLVVFWVTFEYIHLNWKLTWPWLTLGNGFATYHTWIQWYEYTGVLGGSIWVLVVNILVFKWIRIYLQKLDNKRKLILHGILPVLLILLPIFISEIRYHSYKETSDPVNVVVAQPNIDPYNEQYSLPPEEIIKRNLGIIEPLLSDKPAFILSPESAIQEGIWESQLDRSQTLKMLQKFTRENQGKKIIIGASTYRRIPEGESIPGSARYLEKGDFYYDRFNTAFLIDSSGDIQKHHKSKLTPGVEYMPSWGPLSFLEDMAIDLGGTVGSLGTEKEQIPFVSGGLKVAPLICYESVYGEFCGHYVKNGAQLIFVITNDGWWGNTPGHKQHLYFSSLRAIEHRRSVARSANTGISCFVNQRGDLSQITAYWEPAAIAAELNANSKQTFYTMNGDYFGRIASFLSVLFILIAFVFGIRRRKQLKR